ncbi:MAG TPA: fibronectin type III domain-containing protein [Candidatus Deferrimicrobium sp.]|nr:fibronectin type III domain-containing protein [Candidatus Kapabacteria bacterium]HLP62457.1 fibronectin type III domain-containing protein [Candidatus Deferrimicrobium sp.]
MEKLIILVLTVFLFFSPVFSRADNTNGKEFFLVNQESPIYLSFENYQMKDGWTPVALSIGELDLLLWMDENGKVLELPGTGGTSAYDEPVCIIDIPAHCLKKNGTTLYFEVYDQNDIRLRWRLFPANNAGKMVKKLIPGENGVDVCLGDLRLHLTHATWNEPKFSTGLSRVQISGIPITKVTSYQDTVYEKEKEIILKPRALLNIPALERAALIALYKSTNGDRWGRKQGWKTPPLAEDGFALPGTENTWYGITCDTGNTTVLTINFRNNGLEGPIPPEIGNLTNLQYLYLQNNGGLTGSIPTEIGNLANLQGLFLDFNNLNGALPLSLGNLVKLKYLQLFHNRLHGSIPPELGSLANLQYLNLSQNFIGGSIPPELGNLANLESLFLNNNQLSGSIPPELGNLVNLKVFNAAFNKLNGIIPSSLGNLIKLQNLQLERNQLSGSIPPQLGNLVNLQSLSIGDQLSGNIPPELGNLVNLQNLYFYNNNLSGSVPPELGNLVNLQNLYLGINQLSGSIPPQLGNLVNLKNLYMNRNQLSGSIPPQLGNLVNLQYLVLCENQLSGSIPPELGNMVNLKSFELNWNQLSGNIPPELANLDNLGIMALNQNQLTGAIPPELGNMDKLKTLWLGNNHLSGTIPLELANLSNLEMLDIGFNQLSGSILPELANLPMLFSLHLNSNRFSGDIPANFINSNLFEIELRWNALFTNDETLKIFLNERQFMNDWESTQTIAPANITAKVISPSSIVVNWSPILYTADTGGYSVYYGTNPGGPYTYFGMTADKTISSLTVTGLQPGFTYYFVVKSRTNPHENNENIVESEFSPEVSVFLPPLILTSPNGEEIWRIRTIQKITWDSLGLNGKIRIELWKAGKRIHIIAPKFPVANGNYFWLVGNSIFSILKPGNDYTIKIITANGVYSDISDGNFSIVN